MIDIFCLLSHNLLSSFSSWNKPLLFCSSWSEQKSEIMFNGPEYKKNKDREKQLSKIFPNFEGGKQTKTILRHSVIFSNGLLCFIND